MLPPTHHTHPKKKGDQNRPSRHAGQSTHAYCGNVHGDDFCLTVAQAAKPGSPLAHPPRSANTASRIKPLAKGARPASSWHTRQHLTPPCTRPCCPAPGPRLVCTPRASASPDKPAPTARLVRTYWFFFCRFSFCPESGVVARELNELARIQTPVSGAPGDGTKGLVVRALFTTICARRYFLLFLGHLLFLVSQDPASRLGVGYSHATRRAWLSPPRPPTLRWPERERCVADQRDRAGRELWFYCSAPC